MNKIFIGTALALLFSAGAMAAKPFLSWTEAILQADKDRSESISMKEVTEFQANDRYPGFRPFMSQNFTTLDANGDGVLTMEEFEAGTKSMGMSDEQVSDSFIKGLDFMPYRQR